LPSEKSSRRELTESELLNVSLSVGVGAIAIRRFKEVRNEAMISSRFFLSLTNTVSLSLSLFVVNTQGSDNWIAMNDKIPPVAPFSVGGKSSQIRTSDGLPERPMRELQK
jgi:hypothetical protein